MSERILPKPGNPYTIQAGDTLVSIAQQAYGNKNLSEEIYLGNREVIGNNPLNLVPGTKLYLQANPQQSLTYLNLQSSTVTAQQLQIRTKPTSQSSIVATIPQDSTLNFTKVIAGEPINGNPSWALFASQIVRGYFWLGGTDQQNPFSQKPVPGGQYIVKEGDTLDSIAQQVYNDDILWELIYMANAEMIGNNPLNLAAGTKLHLLPNPLQTQTFLNPQCYTVTASQGLNVRTAPSTTANTVPPGLGQNNTFSIMETVSGDGLPWGELYSPPQYWGNYTWLGGAQPQPC